MNILDIHIGHRSSASLIIDGKIVADVASERFALPKHYAGLPIQSLQFCLDVANIDIRDIGVIAVPAKKDVFELNYLLNLGEDQKRKEGT